MGSNLWTLKNFYIIRTACRQLDVWIMALSLQSNCPEFALIFNFLNRLKTVLVILCFDLTFFQNNKEGISKLKCLITTSYFSWFFQNLSLLSSPEAWRITILRSFSALCRALRVNCKNNFSWRMIQTAFQPFIVVEAYQQRSLPIESFLHGSFPFSWIHPALLL